MFDTIIYGAGQTIIMILWSVLASIVVSGIIGAYYSKKTA
jgi:hypothetical protein